MAGFKRFEEIQGWQRARELVREIYQLCEKSKLGKDFSLRDQICRAGISVMSNIAEGFARNSNKDFAHFLDISKASAAEVQSLLYIASDLGYLSQDDFVRIYGLADETASLTGGLIIFLRKP
jgi:four helix bundle protein